MKKLLFNYVIPYLLFGLVYLWCMTLRSKNMNEEEENHFKNLTGPYILTLWHGRIFYLFYYLRRHPDYFLLISPSEDGDLLASLARLMGYSVIRGSTYKKAVSAAEDHYHCRWFPRTEMCGSAGIRATGRNNRNAYFSHDLRS